ncbi:MAG TPA: lysophospholipid acyltransferase family protein [Candidatus Wallbacteria bacterium]|nr:lysophospholipid acyltransferase family protein [Candidatus Wallbacteria bacterium]
MSLLKNNPALKNFLDSAADSLLRIAVRFFSRFEIKTISKLKFIGTLFYYLLPLRKQTLIENIQKSGICKTGHEIELLVKNIYIAQVLNFFEFLWMGNLQKTKPLQDNFRFHGLDNLRNGIAGREGGVIISSHLGNWEMLAVICGKLGLDFSILIVERDIKIHRTINEFRSVTSNKPIDRNHAALKCMRLIKNKKFAGIVSDQHTDNAGVKNKFFGIDCMSTSLPAALSIKTGAPIYGVFMIRSADGYTHDVYIEPPLYAKDFVENGDRDSAITRCTQAVTDMIEKYIRMAPEQWFWFHKRWRADKTGISKGGHLSPKDGEL